MTVDPTPNPITLGISILGLLGGILSYILNLKVNHDILTNNAKYDELLNDMRQEIEKEITNLREELSKEITLQKDRVFDRTEGLNRELTELKSSLGDRIITTINGKYIRTDFYTQGMSAMQDRTSSLQKLLEMSLKSLEEGINRQISDLKERIFSHKL